MDREELNYKLNKIYDELISIKLKIDRIEDYKHREEAEKKKNEAECQIREIDYMDNNRWRYEEEMKREFNPRWAENIAEERAREEAKVEEI